MPVLERFANAATDPTDRDKICHDFRYIVGTIVCLGEPLSRTALAALLDMEDESVTLRLNNLPSVLHVPKVADKPVRPLHLSFGEFLTSETCKDEAFRVDVRGTHVMLWQRCLRLLSGTDGLREDICNLKHPGHLRREVSLNLVNQHLRPAVQYACRYWVYHFQSSVSALSDEDEVHKFLQHHFLHWLEALSLLDRLADAIKFINILQLQNTLDNSGHVTAFLEDARRFLLANRFVAELAPLQLYSSALAFAPQNSIVRRQCGPLAAWIQQHPITPLTWSLELQKLEGHTSWVKAVAFSPDGSLLVSASDDRTVRLWQVSTGQEVQKFEGDTYLVNAVAFSPDGSLLALALYDRTVRLWQVSTGQEVQKLKGHTSLINAVAFSPDGLLLASASYDETVRLWQVSIGQEVQKLEGHTSSVSAVAFSSDGSLLASASWDEIVRLWQVSTCQTAQILKATGVVRELAFSSDNTKLITDREHLYTSLPASTSSYSATDSGYFLRHDWVEYQGQKLLWLPQEYRTSTSAIYGNTIGIGQGNGHVSFLKLHHV
ncbi:hypothetical protein GJ744_004375 [Endocarpon pusillum]|uniref:Mitochondrial division protein 1 n=1 Tax=Endocarpon pusillum TaxID=364733 RepID=A0A8H7ARB4_9EURO|nr:hypothetical protein GJ744_004375 [Endocarpon pusillum]